MKFVVDRKTWYRGQGHDDSRLLLNNGMMCCLGHIALQCGLTEMDIHRKTSPGKVGEVLYEKGERPPAKFKWLLDNELRNTPIANQMMSVNDHVDITDAEREDRLKALAADAGHELEFIN